MPQLINVPSAKCTLCSKTSSARYPLTVFESQILDRHWSALRPVQISLGLSASVSIITSAIPFLRLVSNTPPRYAPPPLWPPDTAEALLPVNFSGQEMYPHHYTSLVN